MDNNQVQQNTTNTNETKKRRLCYCTNRGQQHVSNNQQIYQFRNIR